MEDLRGRVAVVTGGASGIGYALAERFAAEGAGVVLADVEEAALSEAGAKLRSGGADVLEVVTDVGDAAQVEALAERTVAHFGAVHVVCNNAGVVSLADPWLGPLAAWEWVLGVNLWGVIYGVRAFMPHMVLGGRGHIVNTASMAGLFPGLNPIYDATKHAVVAISENLYHDMRAAQLPVGVSVLCPGWVRTQIVQAERNWPGERGMQPARSAVGTVVAAHVQRATDEGLTPAAVADIVAAGIEEERFWLLTHPDWMPMALARWDSIAEGVNPAAPENVPGIERSKMVEEIMAAMAAEQ